MASCQRHRTSWVAVALLLVVGVFCSAASAVAHSSLRYPLERTQDISCRIGSIQPRHHKNCPGPCSRQKNRDNYKVLTFKRGETIPLVYYKNNHSGTSRCFLLGEKSIRGELPSVPLVPPLPANHSLTRALLSLAQL